MIPELTGWIANSKNVTNKSGQTRLHFWWNLSLNIFGSRHLAILDLQKINEASHQRRKRYYRPPHSHFPANSQLRERRHSWKRLGCKGGRHHRNQGQYEQLVDALLAIKSAKHDALPQNSLEGKWWEWQGLNLWPLRCQRSATFYRIIFSILILLF